jgi:hypothetical protein
VIDDPETGLGVGQSGLDTGPLGANAGAVTPLIP